MKADGREIRFLIAAFLILFCGLALLSIFLLAAEARREGILVEYEADRTASALQETYLSEGGLDTGALDSRIRGFGIYDASGEPALRFGDAPPALSGGAQARAFSYDESGRSLSLVRALGMSGQGMGRGMMMRSPDVPRAWSGAAMQGHLAGGGLYLSMDISGYYRKRFTYGAAAVLAPVLIAGIASLFLALLASNLRYRRRAAQRETLARIGETARTLAHEIRNPLVAIRMQTALLRREIPDGSGRELDIIDEEIERLTLLTRRVGDFLKNPRGSPESLDAAEFLRELSRKFPWPVSFPAPDPGHSHRILFDRELLRSVIENLVNNARESYGEEEPAGSVEIALSGEGSKLVIAVRDRGKGIPPEISEKVFDPFFSDKTHGSGIGLSVSRRFVEAAGGSLTLAPREGGGTEARVTLPSGGTA